MADPRPEWMFESTVAEQNGVRITTTITVPTGVRWDDVREAAELAQMGANVTLGHVLKSIARTQEDVPF